MFTDSAFYSPKFHPSVADQVRREPSIEICIRLTCAFLVFLQVEMAHKLSSSLYDDGNKKSKGQEQYLHMHCVASQPSTSICIVCHKAGHIIRSKFKIPVAATRRNS